MNICAHIFSESNNWRTSILYRLMSSLQKGGITMYQTGKDRESLLALLKSLSELTGIDRTVRSGQKFSIDAEIIDHGMKWRLETDPKGYSSSGIETARGKGYPSLIKTLKGINVEAKADERIVVIALVEVCEARNYDGTFHTIWCLIDPCEVGFDEKDHCVDRETGTVSYTYQILELDLSESEYKCCCASKLAFYNEFTKILYPIQECAYSSISRMLDCACVFKYNDSPVVSASFLAQRLAGCRRTIRFVYRKRSERVRPLISIVGGAYVQLSQYEFVKDATDTIQTSGKITARETNMSTACVSTSCHAGLRTAMLSFIIHHPLAA